MWGTEPKQISSGKERGVAQGRCFTTCLTILRHSCCLPPPPNLRLCASHVPPSISTYVPPLCCRLCSSFRLYTPTWDTARWGVRGRGRSGKDERVIYYLWGGGRLSGEGQLLGGTRGDLLPFHTARCVISSCAQAHFYGMQRHAPMHLHASVHTCVGTRSLSTRSSTSWT